MHHHRRYQFADISFSNLLKKLREAEGKDRFEVVTGLTRLDWRRGDDVNNKGDGRTRRTSDGLREDRRRRKEPGREEGRS